MDEKRTAAPGRTSGIPRLSRLPVPRTSSLRTAASRESLNGELRNPRLRPAASRDQLASSAGLARSDSWDVSSTRSSQPVRSSSNRLSTLTTTTDDAHKRSSEPVIPSTQPDAQKDEILFKRPLVLTRRPSDLFNQSPLSTPASSTSTSSSTQHPFYEESNHNHTRSADDHGFSFDAPTRTIRPRPSLSERTMETLAQLPSSPSISKKGSTFFEPLSASKRPRSRPGSANGSRPGTGYRSDGAGRPPSRPCSSSGGEDGLASSLRASASGTYKSPLSTIDGTPARRTPRPLKDALRANAGRIPPSSVLSSPSLTSETGRSPSPQKSAFVDMPPPIKGVSKTVGARPLRPRASVGGLFKKPSMQRLDNAASEAGGTPRKVSMPAETSSGWDGSIAPPVPAIPTDSADAASTALTARKSSAALREQIAKAKAAKRAALREASAAREARGSHRTEEEAQEPPAEEAAETKETKAPSPVPGPAEILDLGTFYGVPASANPEPTTTTPSPAEAQPEPKPAPITTTLATTKPRATTSRPTASTSKWISTSVAPASPPAPATASSSTSTSPVMSHSDPFNQNQRRSSNAKQKMLLQRVKAARSSGRLNIAAMGLKTIPPEVLRMYDAEMMGTYDGSWAESVDLTRLIAADNEIETIDDCIFPDKTADDFAEEEESPGNVFGGLETLDLHGNLLISVPVGLRRLSLLTSLNLSQNRLSNPSLDAISQITSLRDLKLGNNLLYGPLDSCFSNLRDLEILDLHGNNVSSLPAGIEKLSRLRILNISENSFESLSFTGLAKLPLTELLARRNKLSGTLINDPEVQSLPNLQSLDISCNQVVRLCAPGSTIRLPSLHQLSASMNRLQGLPDVSSWTSLLTLVLDENSISTMPEGFMTLTKLRHADFSSNDIRVVPPEIGRMDNLAMIRLSGNPLRDKKFASITTDELKDILAGRLEPPPPYQERTAGQAAVPLPIAGGLPEEPKALTVNTTAETAQPAASPVAIHNDADDDSRGSDMDDFATPPTSAPVSPARSRSQTVGSNQSQQSQLWPVKPGGILDRSHTESTSLHPVICSRVAADHKVREAMLHHNLFATLPSALSFFADTLTALSLANNQLIGASFLSEELRLPALRELNLSSNHITSITPLTTFLVAPMLEKVDVSFNRIASLPPPASASGDASTSARTTPLRTAFPRLTVLLASNNHIVDLDPEALRGFHIVDVGNNDIAHLNPRIGLLGGHGGLQRLEVSGNRFRVPRWSVLERGTEATLRWLRGRVPIAEMSAWREGNGSASDGSSPETSLADVD